jgi:hypothetical protein
MPEILKVCRDRILPHELFRPQRTRRADGALRAVLEFRKMWINGWLTDKTLDYPATATWNSGVRKR